MSTSKKPSKGLGAFAQDLYKCVLDAPERKTKEPVFDPERGQVWALKTNPKIKIIIKDVTTNVCGKAIVFFVPKGSINKDWSQMSEQELQKKYLLLEGDAEEE